jgi:RNA polymerase sigma-70 factor (ECF subfamily)
VALEALLTDGAALPSRRDHEVDTSKTALDSIMGDVDLLSRGR